MGGQTLPAALQRMTTTSGRYGQTSTGVRQLTDKTNWTNKVHDKVINRFPRASGGVDNGLIVAIDFAI